MKLKKPAHYKEILDAFESVWKNEAEPPQDIVHDEPLDGLLLTVLSQHTNDKLRDKAFANLKHLYPTWAEVDAAPVEKVADAVRICGLGNTKAQKIKMILPLIKEKFGDYSIKSMAQWDLDEAYKYLLDLPGVGVKTAACTLVFDLGLPAFPVDTHVMRISKRLGWAPEKMPAEKIQKYLEATLPPERFRGAHLNMIEHGRGICDARKPKCNECPAKKWCAYGKTIDG